MKKIAAIILLFLFSSTIYGQEETTDSTKILDEVTIKAFEQNKSSRNSTATVKIIEFNNGDRNNKTSLVNGFNTVAGVRMEERSPGSYRINLQILEAIPISINWPGIIFHPSKFSKDRQEVCTEQGLVD